MTETPELEPSPAVEHHRRHPALIAAAIAAPVAVIAGIITASVVARHASNEPPLTVSSLPAPQADSATCGRVVTAMPSDLDDFQRATLTDPVPAGVAGWVRNGDVTSPIILRCGIDRPAEFVVGAALTDIDGVQWQLVADPTIAGSTEPVLQTWYAVDREVYIAVTMDSGNGPNPLKKISDAINATLPAKDLDPAPAPPR